MIPPTCGVGRRHKKAQHVFEKEGRHSLMSALHCVGKIMIMIILIVVVMKIMMAAMVMIMSSLAEGRSSRQPAC